MPDNIIDLTARLQQEVKNDSFNLTRDDQDAICNKIDELKKFMQETYEQHKHIV